MDFLAPVYMACISSCTLFRPAWAIRQFRDSARRRHRVDEETESLREHSTGEDIVVSVAAKRSQHVGCFVVLRWPGPTDTLVGNGTAAACGFASCLFVAVSPAADIRLCRFRSQKVNNQVGGDVTPTEHLPNSQRLVNGILEVLTYLSNRIVFEHI